MIKKVPIPPVEDFKDCTVENYKKFLLTSVASLYTGHIPGDCLKFYTEYLLGFLSSHLATIVQICDDENLRIPNFDKMCRDLYAIEAHCINTIIDFNEKEEKAIQASEDALENLNNIVANFSKKNGTKDDDDVVN